jgi:hypothetical protein
MRIHDVLRGIDGGANLMRSLRCRVASGSYRHSFQHIVASFVRVVVPCLVFFFAGSKEVMLPDVVIDFGYDRRYCCSYTRNGAQLDGAAELYGPIGLDCLYLSLATV